jgi:hypothetical protein
VSLVTSSTELPTRHRTRRVARILSAGVFAVALAVSGGLAANAAPGALLTTNVATASQGGFFSVSATGFAANEAVDVTLDTVFLGSEQADGAGAVTVNGLSIPAGTTPGVHALTASALSGASTGTITVVAQPTITAAVTTITASEFAAGGVKVDAAGFVNGDTVEFGGTFGIGGGNAIGAPIIVAGGTASVVVLPSNFTTPPATGDIAIVAGTLNSSYRTVAVTIHVVADAAAPVKGNASFTG